MSGSGPSVDGHFCRAPRSGGPTRRGPVLPRVFSFARGRHHDGLARVRRAHAESLRQPQALPHCDARASILPATYCSDPVPTLQFHDSGVRCRFRRLAAASGPCRSARGAPVGGDAAPSTRRSGRADAAATLRADVTPRWISRRANARSASGSAVLPQRRSARRSRPGPAAADASRRTSPLAAWLHGDAHPAGRGR